MKKEEQLLRLFLMNGKKPKIKPHLQWGHHTVAAFSSLHPDHH
jgi:hypothetical protein